MNASTVLLLALGIGAVAGLRAMTAPAVVAWAAHLGWLNLAGSNFAFMGSMWAVAIFTLAALGEFVNDQLPKTPARTAVGPLTARIVMGALAGVCLAVAASASLPVGALLGAIGAVVGAFAGYKARVELVKSLSVPDFAIAIPEDLLAIGRLSCWCGSVSACQAAKTLGEDFYAGGTAILARPGGRAARLSPFKLTRRGRHHAVAVLVILS